MIESERTQNLIIASAIIFGVISAGIIVVNSNYYSGSYALAHYTEVSLENIRLTNLDPSNESLIPGLYFTLNVQTRDDSAGDAALTYITVWPYLNGEAILYATFTRQIPLENQKLYPSYDQNYTVSSSILDESDQQILFDAYTSANWTWAVVVRYWYSVISPDNLSFREISFAYAGVSGIDL
ncbi:MAG: hypothetical protein ACFFAY_09070 [Promethearchaeota archaeon]